MNKKLLWLVLALIASGAGFAAVLPMFKQVKEYLSAKQSCSRYIKEVVTILRLTRNVLCKQIL